MGAEFMQDEEVTRDKAAAQRGRGGRRGNHTQSPLLTPNGSATLALYPWEDNVNPVLSLHHIRKSFRDGVPVLHDISLQVEAGTMVCILGPSGCGKTTLLRLVAGFEEPDAGEIYLIKRLVSRSGLVVPPEQRHVGMVFQDYALFPHMTVSQNIQFGLFRWPAAWRRTRLTEMLRLVGLEGMADRYPHELSGGQQQRVALARALAPAPQLLLLDEPFSNLDVHLRQQLRPGWHHDHSGNPRSGRSAESGRYPGGHGARPDRAVCHPRRGHAATTHALCGPIYWAGTFSRWRAARYLHHYRTG